MSYVRPPHDQAGASWVGVDPVERPAHDAAGRTWLPPDIEYAIWIFDATIPAPIPPITLTADVDYFVPLIAGTITDAMDNPAGRRIYVHDRATGALLGATDSDPVTGAYQFQVPGYGEYQRIVLAEDESDPLLNDLIDRVKVEWPEA